MHTVVIVDAYKVHHCDHKSLKLNFSYISQADTKISSVQMQVVVGFISLHFYYSSFMVEILLKSHNSTSHSGSCTVCHIVIQFCGTLFDRSRHIQSIPQDQKSVIFSHSVISPNQLLQNSKNTAYIFLTFRKGQNISLRIFCIMF